jgi:hypothetical protein
MRIRSIRSLLFALVLLAMSAAAYAQISISINFAPPELPVYEQPLCPGAVQCSEIMFSSVTAKL